MNAFVLAAGFGTRLRPLTDTLPKPLAPVLNIPSICYTLFLLKEAGIRRAVINIHYHPDSIRRFFEHHDFGSLEVVLSEETTILGTGGGLKKCEHLLDGEDFVLINGDVISDIDLKSLIETHRKNGTGGTLALYETPLAKEIGYVGVRDGLVHDFRNLRETGLVSSLIYTGTAVLKPDIFRHLGREFSSIVTTGFTGLIDNGGLGYYQHRGLWKDIGTLQSFHEANITGNLRILELAPRMREAIGIGPHAISEAAAISDEAAVRQSVVGEGCVVGPSAVVERSVLLPGTCIAPCTVISDSIAGPGWVATP